MEGGSPDNTPFTTDSEALYPALGRTTISLRHLHSDVVTDTLEILLGHTMPDFDKFLACLNAGRWKESPAEFRWILQPGEISIEAVAVNRMGIMGKTSRIVLRNNIASHQEGNATIRR